jgi:hypothetical protein
MYQRDGENSAIEELLVTVHIINITKAEEKQ